MVFTIVRLLQRNIDPDSFNLDGSLAILIMLLPVYMFSFAVTFNISKW